MRNFIMGLMLYVSTILVAFVLGWNVGTTGVAHPDYENCDTLFVLERVTEHTDGPEKLEYRVEYPPKGERDESH